VRRFGSSRIAGRAGSRRIAGRAGGFTLIEMLGVLLLLTLVFGVALDTYVDLSLQTRRASSFTRDARRATALLDRVGADLAAAVLAVKPEGRDPLQHPWLFLAEARGGTGADRLKFVTAGRPPMASASHASDLAQVALLTAPAPDGSLELLRWSHPHLPDALDRSLPRADDPGVLLLAEGLERFGVRFLDEAGEWSDRWDSTALARSSQLPLAVEIEVSWAPQAPGEEPIGPYTRRVVLPLRPFDLEARLTGKEPGAPGEQDEEDEEKKAEEESCLRVRDCVDVRALPPDLMNVVFDLMDQCLSDTGIPDDVLLPECR
jgi:type II secretory pathway pseudopilin PulG